MPRNTAAIIVRWATVTRLEVAVSCYQKASSSSFVTSIIFALATLSWHRIEQQLLLRRAYCRLARRLEVFQEAIDLRIVFRDLVFIAGLCRCRHAGLKQPLNGVGLSIIYISQSLDE